MTWPTSVPILAFLGLSLLDLGTMYATDRRRQTSDAHRRLMPPSYGGGGIIIRRGLLSVAPYVEMLGGSLPPQRLWFKL